MGNHAHYAAKGAMNSACACHRACHRELLPTHVWCGLSTLHQAHQPGVVARAPARPSSTSACAIQHARAAWHLLRAENSLLTSHHPTNQLHQHSSSHHPPSHGRHKSASDHPTTRSVEHALNHQRRHPNHPTTSATTLTTQPPAPPP
eukprot:365523-Chlamydomonas_euryale.AAC.4